MHAAANSTSSTYAASGAASAETIGAATATYTAEATSAGCSTNFCEMWRRSRDPSDARGWAVAAITFALVEPVPASQLLAELVRYAHRCSRLSTSSVAAVLLGSCLHRRFYVEDSVDSLSAEVPVRTSEIGTDSGVPGCECDRAFWWHGEHAF